jgi:PAS domain S-box-containing protein
MLPRSAGIEPERRLATQHAAVSALAESASVSEAVPRLLEAVARGLEWEFGALWMPSPNGGAETLRCVHSWAAPDTDAERFAERCMELEFESGVGLPGRVWESGAPAWVTDVSADPNFSRAEAATRAGLHSAFAFPVVRGDTVLAVLEFLTREMRDSDAGLLADFSVFGFQMGQFIGREIAEHELRDSRDQLEAILRGVPAGIMVVDHRGTIVFANETVARLAGLERAEDVLSRDAEEVLADWELFDEHGEPVPQEELPGTKALHGVESRSALLKSSRSGEERWLMARATPVPDGRGRHIAVSVFEEISEIKSTEAALRESEMQHRSVSRTLQQGLAPPSAPEVPGLQVAVRFRALGEASEIGGDFYDLFRTGDRRWGVLVGDVSGKGVEAAATAALARHTVRATAQHDDDPRYVLSMLNQAIGRQVQGARFCTAVYATIELGELWMRMQVASAGHPAPVLLRSHGGTEEIGGRGPLLAGFEDAAYRCEPAHLAAGDSLVLYTDGVTDAIERRSGNGGLDATRLNALLGACVGLDAAGIAQRIADAVTRAEAGDPRDDAAVLILRSPPMGG